MLAFLRENWLWIAAPLVLLLIIVLALLLAGSGDEAAFIYPIN